MAKRTRRDLSDRHIRNIVRQHTKEGKQQKATSPSVQFPASFKTIFIPAIIVFFFVLIYFLVKSVNIESFLISGTEEKVPSQTIEQSQSQKPAAEPPATQVADTVEEKQPEVNPVQQKTQIEILNGCGVSGIALKATKYSRRHNLDVVSMGNYSNFDLSTSKVIGWTGDKDVAMKVARVFGIPEKNVEIREDKNKQLDATVILGKDYQELNPFQ